MSNKVSYCMNNFVTRQITGGVSVNTNNIPLYVKVSDSLRFKIHAGEWQIGDQIPTEMELCETYDVSRITVRRAIEQLVQEGLLSRKRAVGTFVQSVDTQTSGTLAKSFSQEMTDLGRQAHTLHASIQKIPASRKIANFLNVNVGQPVMNLRRIFGTNELAFAFFDTYFSCEAPCSLNAADYYGSFYQYLQRFGIVINSVNEYVEAVLPDAELMQFLHVGRHVPLLKRVRFTEEVGKDFREYSECFYIGSEYRYYINSST